MPKGKISWIPESGFPYVHGGEAIANPAIDWSVNS